MRIAIFLGKLFNVRAGEWPRLSLLYAMSLVALTGMTWGDAIVQAAFLQRVGVQYLPWVLIGSAACSVAALFIYSAFADRVSNTRVLIAILAISAAGILLGLALLAGGRVGPAYLLLYLTLNVPLLDLYNVHWATYVNGFYDTRVAKRIVPVLGTAARVAGIFGGLTMPLLNRFLSPSAIIAVMLITLAAMAILAAAMPRFLYEGRAGQLARPGPQGLTQARRHDGPAAPSALLGRRIKDVGSAYGANLREGYAQAAHSPFLRWMALSALAMTVLLALLNYRASAIFQADLKTTVQISNFLGVLSGLANLAVLPIQLFLLSRLITRFGLGNASLIYPMTTLAAAGGLVVAPGLAAAGLAYVDRTALRTAFRSPTENLLYNAVPLRVKARTRAFVGGLVVPLGAIAGGLLLLTPLARTPWFLSAAILGLALAFALAALQVRRYYGPALVALLEQEDGASLALQAPSLQEPASLPAGDAATLARLARRLDESASSERAVFMAHLIAEIGGEAAVPIIGRAARAAIDARLRASLIDVLAAAGARGGGARELYAAMLADGDGQVRLAAIGGLEQVDGPGDSRYLALAARALADPDLAVRLRVLPALLGAGAAGCEAAAGRELRALLNAPDAHTRARAVQAVGQARAVGFLPELVRALADRADEVRLAAALAAERLAGDDLRAGYREMLLAFVIALLYDPVERARAAAITVLGRLGLDSGPAAPIARGALAANLAGPSPALREQAVEALARAGRRAIPHAEEQLSAADPQLRKMAAIALARIEPRKYAPLVCGPILDESLRAVYRNLACVQALAGSPDRAPAPGPVVAVLARALRERNAALLDEIFYLLAAVQDPAAVKTVVHSLRSPQPLLRANAIEALESLTTPQTAALIAPLFEPDVPPEQLPSLVRQACDTAIPTPGAALRLLLGDAADPRLRALAAAVVAELSAAGRPSPPQAELAELLDVACADQDPTVRAEVSLAAAARPQASRVEAMPDARALSPVAKLVSLQAAPFFQGMTVDQLQLLAAVCEEKHFPAAAHIFDEGDAGGAFYLVLRGRVAIEQGTRPGSRARLAVIDAPAYFGDGNLFDDSPRADAGVALQDTLALRLRREPVIELARRHPDISLELINALAQRLREANDQIAGLARSRPRRLQRLFDSLEQDLSPH